MSRAQLNAMMAMALVASASVPEDLQRQVVSAKDRGAEYDENVAAQLRAERKARKAANFAKRHGQG